MKILLIIVILAIVGGAVYLVMNNSGSNLPTPTPSMSSSPMPTVSRTPIPSGNPSPTSTVSPTPTPTSTPTPTPLLHSVLIVNFAYNQQTITVRKGDTVTWTNKDSMSHTVTGDGGLNSPMLNLNGTYSFTFNTPGTYNYHCTPHPYMTGRVIVTQ